MEKRETALREVLDKNYEENQRWESYMKDNETAIENINMFSKRLTADVMVPVGRRAFIPGRLIHTNEVLVGHYQDYFSKCTGYTAIEICKRRIENAKQHLKQLEAEKDLFQNKLERPYLEGVLPNLEEREIIEEYDEQKEKAWREEHRKRVREAKLNEKQDRHKQLTKENAHDELIYTLDEEKEEMLRELDEELSGLNIKPENETEEILSKLMSGELDLPSPKNRIAHPAAAKRDNTVHLMPIESKTNIQSGKSIANGIVNSHLPNMPEEFTTDGNESDTSLGSDTPEEIRLIEEQAEYLPHGDRLGFFQYQLQIFEKKLETRFVNQRELEEKMQLYRIRDHLTDIIEILEDAALLDVDDSQAANLEREPGLETTELKTQKKQVLFALKDDTLEFRKNETVDQMLSLGTPTNEPLQRDIVRLDEPILFEDQTQNTDCSKLVDRRKTILEKVEDNLRTQSPEDADLVTKIIGSSTNHAQTLHIHFKHSTEVLTNNPKTEIPSSPADLYQMVCVEENQTSLVTKDADNEKAYVDVRSQFLSPVSGENCGTQTQSRSILKNKSAVELETHVTQNKEKSKASPKKIKKPKQEEEYLSAYNKVMSEVIENQVTVPDPLPDEKFIDMHTPKKRISRFKQMRNEIK